MEYDEAEIETIKEKAEQAWKPMDPQKNLHARQYEVGNGVKGANLHFSSLGDVQTSSHSLRMSPRKLWEVDPHSC